MWFLVLLGALSSPTVSLAVETGSIDGASFRIDIPGHWNGDLIIYCHGYSPAPISYNASDVEETLRGLLDQGYAIAKSGYRKGGWAISEDVEDIEALRKWFVGKHGNPKHIYIIGHSLGAFLTLVIMEKYPTVYDGGLALCGPLAAANWFLARRVFDLRVVFDYYFPDILPNPRAVTAAFPWQAGVDENLLQLFKRNPEKARSLLSFSGVHTLSELAWLVPFFSYVLADIQQKAGGNPFDNRNIIYGGSDDDDALNLGVRRYAADPTAAAYLEKNYTPTGHLLRPLLSVEGIYDPMMPDWVKNSYSSISIQPGHKPMFAQIFVSTPGHCAISGAELLEGFSRMQRWSANGERPQGPLN